MGRDLELPWSELLSTGRGSVDSGALCSGCSCSSTAWLQTVEVDHQTLAWIIGQLDPVGAVCKSFDYAVGSCPWEMQFPGVVAGQDSGV